MKDGRADRVSQRCVRAMMRTSALDAVRYAKADAGRASA